MAEIAKDVGTIGGIATVSVLHSFIPTHWLPFSIVGRAQNWSIHRILLVSKSPFPNPPKNLRFVNSPGFLQIYNWIGMHCFYCYPTLPEGCK
jgi:hypothetical protein